MEHEHEVAAPAPAAPVVAAPAAAGAGPPLTTALTPARVLALQRTIGNRATGAILARVPAAGAGDFGFSGGVPVSSGSVIASKEGADKVNVKAPLVTLDGAAWLKKDRELGTSAYIGVVQNLVSSVRGAVYRHGGDPAGEIVAEHVSGQANKRDAVSDPNNNAQPQTFAPFYWQPGNIDDSNVEGTPAKSSRLGTPNDQPEFDMPVTSGPGRITSFKGHDTFKMGLAIKKEAAVWMLTGTTWTVDWNVPVDKDLSGAGKAIEAKPVQDLLKDGPDVSLTAWTLDKNAMTPFEAFSTQADAMKRSPAELLGWLFAARQHDPISYKNICGALDAKAPDLSVAVNCEKTDVLFGKDVMSAAVKVNGALIKSESAIRLNNGESHTVKVGWGEAIGSASALTPGTAITVELTVGQLDTKIVTVPFPFKSGGEVAPGTGKYKLSLSI